MLKRIYLIVLLFFGTFSAFSQLVINEIDADTPSSDTKEFVELKSDTPYFPLDDYVLVFFNGANNLSYYTIDLSGYSTDLNGIFLIGNPTLSPAPAITFPNNTLQNGPDAVALYTGSGADFPNNTPAVTDNLADAVAYSNNGTFSPNTLMLSLGLSSFVNENKNNNAANQSIQLLNGEYAVKQPTPGVHNDGSGQQINYVTVSLSPNQTTFNEGESFNFVFTVDKPVENQTLIMNFELYNENFTMADFQGGLTVSIPVGGTTTYTTIILVDDGIEEGDEEMLFKFQPLQQGYIANNDNFKIRIADVNFSKNPWGTPLNPTYGIVEPTTPEGYYSTLEGLSGDELKLALQDIIANPEVVRAHNYGDAYDILYVADQNPENNNQVWLMYVERPSSKLDRQADNSIVGKWNREHIYCQSRGGFSGGTSSWADGIDVWLPTSADDYLAAHADAHHIRAEDGQENTSRGEKNYGSDYNGPIGNNGSWKGDVARAVFYICVRYNGLNVVNGNPSYTPSGVIGNLASLLQWNAQDPADDFEMNRNNYIYTWQKNRNPFIDYPELADYIFGDKYGLPWTFGTAGTADFTAENIKVYPNPTTDYLQINTSSENSFFEIYTITGQMIMSNYFNNNIKLSVSLSSGMYWVKVTTPNTVTTQKVIVK